jgi:hypothetical protein
MKQNIENKGNLRKVWRINLSSIRYTKEYHTYQPEYLLFVKKDCENWEQTPEACWQVTPEYLSFRSNPPSHPLSNESTIDTSSVRDYLPSKTHLHSHTHTSKKQWRKKKREAI